MLKIKKKNGLNIRAFFHGGNTRFAFFNRHSHNFSSSFNRQMIIKKQSKESLSLLRKGERASNFVFIFFLPAKSGTKEIVGVVEL